MAIYETGCLYSTVKNISGQTMKFGFLPPHGKELESDEEITVLGELVDAVTRAQRVTSKRNHDALLKALSGDNDMGIKLLAIVKSPAVFVFDEDSEETHMLASSSDDPVLVDPCTDTSV